MVQRLNVGENETPDRARRRFDGELGVRDWTTPRTEYAKPEPRDPKAPWWWDGAEDASQSFLASMGVTLT
ncbi:hypothetical protein [Streptomyces sp. YKOK-I1]